jgi:uncharacterized protein
MVLWVITGLINVLVAGGIVLAAVLLVPDDAPGPIRTLIGIVPWLLLPLAIVVIGVEPFWRYQVHRWEVTPSAVYTREGWLTRTWRIVPIARIQTVDTTKGPLQQVLGLASISIRTASSAGSTEVEQLDAVIADRVAHDLALRANAVRDEVT